MSRFVQLHLLTSYPPANLNRDDLGRPKTAVMGNVPRLRVSSQSLKRAWRTSDVFKQALSNHMGTRTKEMGKKIFKKCLKANISEQNALKYSRQIAGKFGKVVGTPAKDTLKDWTAALKSVLSKNSDKIEIEKEDFDQWASNFANLFRKNGKGWSTKVEDEFIKLNSDDKLARMVTDLEQLAHFSPEEIEDIDALIQKLEQENREPTKDELQLLRDDHKAVDIALFGRMLADAPIFNTEAAAQVAHAISVHQVTVEDDYFTAIDDLNDGSEDAGAAHLGETEFAAGLFYLYLCIDREALKENLSSDAELASKALSALIESVATVAPRGMQNSFGSRAYASYILCEKGDEQPRSLSVAFLKPITGSDILANAISGLEECREKMNSVYGIDNGEPCILNAQTGQGSIKEMLKYATEELA